MRRWIAVTWHTVFFGLAAAGYFFVVLPRWFELTGLWSPTVGSIGRFATGAVLALCALPVVFTELAARSRDADAPVLASTLRWFAVVAQVVAGVLIVGAAVSEFWLSLAGAGRWLFGIYGAAGALAVLGAVAFHLAWIAQRPAPPPRPAKPRRVTVTIRSRRKNAVAPGAEVAADSAPGADVEAAADPEPSAARAPEADGPDEVAGAVSGDDSETEAPETGVPDTGAPEAGVPEAELPGDGVPEADTRSLRNRRPGGRSVFRRSPRRSGVSVED